MQTLPKIIAREFNVLLPLTQKTVRARAFLVKEEKILLTAIEGFQANSEKDSRILIEAVFQILQSCVLTQTVDVLKLPIVDVEWLFLEIRKNSIGEQVEVLKACKHCDTPNKINVDLNVCQVHFPEGHTNKIAVNENVGLTMAYPSLYETYDISLKAKNMTETSYDLVLDSIDTIYEGEEFANARQFPKEELKQWVEGLSPDVYKEINNFFVTMPYLETKVPFVCEACNGEDAVEVSGITGFFTS
jgi:hypothetical protein